MGDECWWISGPWGRISVVLPSKVEQQDALCIFLDVQRRRIAGGETHLNL